MFRFCLGLSLAAATALMVWSSIQAQEKRPQPPPNGEGLVVHEWGTFTTVQGSDGVVLDGLRHEERDLPAFVHDIRDFAGISGVSPKMETPVIYFYSDRQRKIKVRVNFTRGVITQWYPAADSVNHQGMTLNGAAEKPAGREITDLKDGYIEWGGSNDLMILAPGATEDTQLANGKGANSQIKIELPRVAEDDPWRFCREVDANTLRVCNLNLARKQGGEGVVNEYEKCLFYRGLGDFPLPLKAVVRSDQYHESPLTRADGKVVGTMRTVKLALELTNTGKFGALTHALIVYKRGGFSGFHYVGDIKDSADWEDLVISLDDASETTEQLVKLLTEKLTLTGLYEKEALAMARTWQQGYFNDEGLRVLYVLPRDFVDWELPVTMDAGDGWTYGKHKQAKAIPFVRTFVARCDLLTPSREAELAALVDKAASGDEEALAGLDRWGRFAIPYLKRVLQLAGNEATRALAQRKLDEMKLRR